MVRQRNSSLVYLSLSLILIVFFSLHGTAQSNFKVLHTFGQIPDGQLPTPGLVMDSSGNLYGTTEEGGTGTACGSNAGCGTLFELSPKSDGSWTETILFNFLGDSTTGAFPGGLTFDAAGNLYGTTSTGGPCDDQGCGTVFEFTPNGNGTWTHNTLFDFPGRYDGTFPTYGLTFDEAGNIYGTTDDGGVYNCGTIYELSPSGGAWTHTVLYNFTCGESGARPNGGLLLDSRGNLYGTAQTVDTCNNPNCGGVFKLSKNSEGEWTLKALYEFTGTTDGGNPQAGLAFYNGAIYGTTYFGGDLTCNGADGCGVVFKLTENSDGTWKESIIHSFMAGLDGAFPQSPVLFDSAGNLYGTSQQLSGAGGYGDVFEATPITGGGWNTASLHHFGTSQGGVYPDSIMLDAQGNIYGTTPYGGQIPCGVNSNGGCGVVFEIIR